MRKFFKYFDWQISKSAKNAIRSDYWEKDEKKEKSKISNSEKNRKIEYYKSQKKQFKIQNE